LVRIFVVATTTSKLETTYRVSAGTRPKGVCNEWTLIIFIIDIVNCF
jgi:hypothetical protein